MSFGLVLSICPLGTTQLPLHTFSCNLIFENFVESPSRKFKFDVNLTRITGILLEDVCTFKMTRRILVRMENVSDKSCRENKSTHFVFNNFFFENLAVYEIMWKNMTV
jgi:hypothetical protein